jgi:streptogramin lyase
VRHHAWIQRDARDLAYGGGRVWASLPDADSIARYDPPTRLVVLTRAGSSPAELAVAGGRVFVASYTDHTVVVVDPETMKTIGDPLHMPFNPWAVEAGAGHVWVSGLGSNTLSRIDY